jgi:hypothetical protein
LISTAAFAQSSSPGPYIIDLRGAMSGAPGGAAFYPPVPVETLAPTRAFGFGAGAHVYPLQLGVARIGIGADVMRLRGSAKSVNNSAASMTISALAPQLSFNFGTHDGWSYLSGGYGVAQTTARIEIPAAGDVPAATLTRERRTGAVNLGGGARWFLRERVAVGFDVRFHRLGATSGYPSKQIVGFSIGMSLR